MSSPDTIHLLERYSVFILPALVVAEQIGIPLPAVPALLAVGALAASGHGNIPLVLAAIVLVALPVDLGWYEIGRRRGARVLARLCRVSLEPDFCVRRAQAIFTRYGVRAMLVAKFLPGVTTVTPPLAGIFNVGRARFAVYEVAGVLLWAGAWLAVGYIFSDAIAVVADRAARLGRLLGLAIGGLVAGYVLAKYVRRRLFLRKIRVARITPAALKQRMDAGEDVTIIDLRTRLDVAATPYAIPGSQWIEADKLDTLAAAGLRPHELVLYCACPSEATSARVALRLKRLGITRVRPLEGGLEAWMALGYPVEPRWLPDAAEENRLIA